MSYLALATDRFDAVADFYGQSLGFPVVSRWDRPNARGVRFDLGGGLRLELLDNARQGRPMDLGAPGDRVHVVVEVLDVDDVRRKLLVDAPEPRGTSWGARVFQVRDPDGVPVTFLQWVDDQPPSADRSPFGGSGSGAGS